jgi:hypothetical protein
MTAVLNTNQGAADPLELPVQESRINKIGKLDVKFYATKSISNGDGEPARDGFPASGGTYRHVDKGYFDATVWYSYIGSPDPSTGWQGDAVFLYLCVDKWDDRVLIRNFNCLSSSNVGSGDGFLKPTNNGSITFQVPTVMANYRVCFAFRSSSNLFGCRYFVINRDYHLESVDDW